MERTGGEPIVENMIGVGKPCFIISEIGVNHILERDDLVRFGFDSSLDVAFAMIDAAERAGVDAVKFQTFTAASLQMKGTGKPAYMVENVGDDDAVGYYELIEKYEMSRSDHHAVAEYAAERGLTFFSTPYDRESADFLDDELDVPLFKLASFELTNHLLIKHVARKGKPLILSTGLSDMSDVRETVGLARDEGFVDQLVLMQCTSDYPTRPEDVNLNVLKTYMLEFPDVRIGLSDHCAGLTASVGAVAIGARALEKHFTLDRTLAGPDHKASLDPEGLREWVRSVKDMESCLGSYAKEVSPAEKKNLSMKRYLVMTPQPAGTRIVEDMLTTMRTGTGVPATEENLQKIIGSELKVDVDEPTAFHWGMARSDHPDMADL